MFATLIESSIRNLGAQAITEMAIGIMVAIFAIGVCLKVADRATRLTNYTPNLLSSIGIFGTFCGIVAGLLGFDMSNIDGSIASLLAGMKTAFITSLVGMALSIIFKLFLSGWKNGKKTKGPSDAIGVQDLYASMLEQNKNLEQLNLAIGGDGDSSLVSQLKLLKSDTNDNHRTHMRNMESQQAMFKTFEEDLRVQLKEFSEMLAKSATETVIEALKQVITEFNQKLTEQFGDNFKQLNAAVLELVTWQENYKQQLVEMQAQYALGVSTIKDSELSIANISEHSSAIPTNMQGLEQLLNTNQHQMDELTRHLEVFKDMRDKAVEAVPEIQEQITATLSGMKTGSEQLVSGITESSEKMHTAVMGSAVKLAEGTEQVHASLKSTSDTLLKDSTESTQLWKSTVSDLTRELSNLTEDVSNESKSIATNLRESSQEILEQNQRSLQVFESSFDDMKDHLENYIESSTDKQNEEMQRLYKGLQQEMENALGETGETVKKQIAVIDKALEHEINKSMSDMGDALTSITKRFTQDYTQLVNEMRKVTRT